MTRAPTLADAEALDHADPLAPYRQRFALPPGTIYLDGNSLGALPAATPARLAEVATRQWGNSLIAGWNDHGWIEAPQRIGAAIAPLIGAAADEVIVADSVSVNLFKLLAAALALRPGRRMILSERGNFPTDVYMAEGLAGLGLAELRLAADPAAALGDDVAVLLLSHVHYKSAAVHDMAALTRAAQARGALVLWDLSHSVGALPVDLAGCGADLAVGCGYKYLCGGPGAPAFAFVARRHHGELRQPLSGWMGHAAPFDFSDSYVPAPGMGRLLAGTPPILSLAALEVGVALIAEIGVGRLAAKSQALTGLFLATLGEPPGLTLASPADPAARGSHLAFRHANAHELAQALIARGIIGDFRAPDILRLGFAPACLSFAEIWHAARALADILDSGSWDQPRFRQRRPVT